MTEVTTEDIWGMVASGKATWEDFTFGERTSKGWLLPYLFQLDDLFSKRWSYWGRTLENGYLLDEPIPQIEFLDSSNSETMSMLKKCLTDYNCTASSVYLSDFIEWLLWGFGGTDQRPRKIPKEHKLNEIWYRTFNMGLLLKHPYDYFGELLSETKVGYWSNPNGFYPTPHSIVFAIAQMTFSDTKFYDRDKRVASVCDPCVGTGRMLLYASNYSLNLHGNDIDPVCVMATKVNGYLYAPWLVKLAAWLNDSLKLKFNRIPTKYDRIRRKYLRSI